jgi:hypothetical protein
MARAISVRLDDEALRALARLESSGLSRSAAIRSALVAAAARLRDRKALAAEVAALEADEADCAEMREVAQLMEQLRGRPQLDVGGQSTQRCSPCAGLD